MFGKNPRMTPLELRKRLLLAESELNRVQMAGDVAALTADVRAITNRAKSFSAVAWSVTMLVSALAAFRRGKSADAGAKPSWLQIILKGASLISTVWLAFRSQARSGEGK